MFVFNTFWCRFICFYSIGLFLIVLFRQFFVAENSLVRCSFHDQFFGLLSSFLYNKVLIFLHSNIRCIFEFYFHLKQFLQYQFTCQIKLASCLYANLHGLPYHNILRSVHSDTTACLSYAAASVPTVSSIKFICYAVNSAFVLSQVNVFGVFSCGPPGLTQGVDKACAHDNKYTNGVLLIHHHENI